MKPEATVEALLGRIAEDADVVMRKLGEAIQRRHLPSLTNLSEHAGTYANILYYMKSDFTLPGDWPEIIDTLWGEYQYLAELAREHQSRAMKKQYGREE